MPERAQPDAGSRTLPGACRSTRVHRAPRPLSGCLSPHRITRVGTAEAVTTSPSDCAAALRPDAALQERPAPDPDLQDHAETGRRLWWSASPTMRPSRARSAPRTARQTRLDLRHVPPEEVQLFAAADLVVLPYRRILNSGVVMLSLTCPSRAGARPWRDAGPAGEVRCRLGPALSRRPDRRR